jgi:hypothetical protein
MTTVLKEGDHVIIADRPATAEDIKSGMFYNHFRNLTGIIQKVYSDAEIAVEIDEPSMAEDVEQRHSEIREAMKAKWLDNLSDEARNRLSEEERNFKLRYTVLVARRDLAPFSGDAAIARASEPEAATPKRLTDSEISAAEEAYLRSRKSR